MLLEVYSNGQTRKVVDTFEVRTKGADFVANLRQPFLIKISKDSFTLDIAGKRVIDVPSGLGLPFERGSVHFQQFANVTNANSDQVVTVHW